MSGFQCSYLISILKFAIVIALLLNSIVRQMYELIRQVISVILLARSPNVPVIVKIPFLHSSYGTEQSVASDIKFSPLDQQGSLDVFLDDVCRVAERIIGPTILYDGFNFSEGVANLNARASVRIFTRLHNPNVFEEGVLCKFLKGIFEVCIFRVSQASLDMKGQGKDIEWILTNGLIIKLHIREESLLIRQVIIIFEFPV